MRGHVIDATRFPVGVPEVELHEIPLQMGFADVVEHAADATLHDREIALDGVGMSAAPDVFVLVQHSAEGVGLHVRDMEGADRTATEDQSEEGVLMTSAATDLTFRLATDEGFVGFQDFAFAAERASEARLHGLTDAMSKEPSGLHADTQGALKLAGANTLFAGTHEVDSLEPEMQREMAGFEDGPDPHRKGLPAGVALAQANAGRLPLQPADMLLSRSAEGADSAIGPKVGFDVREGGVFVMEMRLGKDGRHDKISLCRPHWVCQVKHRRSDATERGPADRDDPLVLLSAMRSRQPIRPRSSGGAAEVQDRCA